LKICFGIKPCFGMIFHCAYTPFQRMQSLYKRRCTMSIFSEKRGQIRRSVLCVVGLLEVSLQQSFEGYAVASLVTENPLFSRLFCN
jgi:hypothetical protein